MTSIGPREFPGARLRRTFGLMATCDFCGDYPDTDQTPIDWTTARELGHERVFCATCSREHLRSMEAKLDSEWW